MNEKRFKREKKNNLEERMKKKIKPQDKKRMTGAGLEKRLHLFRRSRFFG